MKEYEVELDAQVSYTVKAKNEVDAACRARDRMEKDQPRMAKRYGERSDAWINVKTVREITTGTTWDAEDWTIRKGTRRG